MYKKAKIYNFQNHLNISKNDTSQHVFHYTSPESLFSIIDNSNLRFSDCQFLNDKSEFANMNTIIQNHKNTFIKQDTYAILNSYEDNLDSNYFFSDITSISPGFSGIRIYKARAYMLSTSMHPDDLNLWNYYVKNDSYQGYNIELEPNSLIECISTQLSHPIEIFHGNVIYDDTEKINIITSILKDVEIRCDAERKNTRVDSSDDQIVNIQEIKGDGIQKIELCRLFFKDSSFSNEKEFRIIIKVPYDQGSVFKNTLLPSFCVKHGVFSPYYDFDIDIEKSIHSITIGPMLETKASKNGLTMFLKSKSFDDINILSSNIPIRY
ncbi:MAG: DUF2971 domain-containing protein [Bacilli bacterium]